MLRIGRTSTPGWCMSMMKAVRPLCFGASGSVRASSKPEASPCAPSTSRSSSRSTTHSSPSRVGAGRQAGDVGAGARLAEQLAPDLLGGEDRAEEPLLLLVGCRGPRSSGPHMPMPMALRIHG